MIVVVISTTVIYIFIYKFEITGSLIMLYWLLVVHFENLTTEIISSFIFSYCGFGAYPGNTGHQVKIVLSSVFLLVLCNPCQYSGLNSTQTATWAQDQNWLHCTTLTFMSWGKLHDKQYKISVFIV